MEAPDILTLQQVIWASLPHPYDSMFGLRAQQNTVPGMYKTTVYFVLFRLYGDSNEIDRSL